MSSDDFQPTIDELLRNNATYAADFDQAALPVPPGRQLAVVACMDARVDVLPILGLNNGDAHVIRNAGGVVTDDVIRSLCLSQRKLGTREIVLIHHTDCGLATVTDDGFKADLEADLGIKPSWAVETFLDPFDDVRQSMRRLQLSPFIEFTDAISGFVYDVASGALQPVDAD